MKRGRPTIAVKKDTVIGVRVTPTLADAVFVTAQRQRSDVSTITRDLWRKWLNEKSVKTETTALST